MKKKIFLAILIITAVSIQIFIIHDEFYKDYSYSRYCKVLKKIDYIEITKHKSNYSSNPERAFIVQWTDNKIIEELEVTPNTFFTTNEGDNIGFKLKHPNFIDRYRFSIGLIFFIFTLGATFGEAIGLVFLIVYLIGTYVFDKKDIFK